MAPGPVIFALDGDSVHASKVAEKTGGELGALEVRHFPDGELYLRIDAPVADREVVIVSSLHQPGTKFLPVPGSTIYRSGSSPKRDRRRSILEGTPAPNRSVMRLRIHGGAADILGR